MSNTSKNVFKFMRAEKKEKKTGTKRRRRVGRSICHQISLLHDAFSTYKIMKSQAITHRMNQFQFSQFTPHTKSIGQFGRSQQYDRMQS